MADVHDKLTRSYNMSQIRGKNTKPEILVRKYLHAKGFRFRIHVNDLPGKPDIVLKKYKTVIFVHGCYWHRHENCRLCTSPATDIDKWQKKFEGTLLRDKIHLKSLKEKDWKVLVIWECELKPKEIEKTLANLPGKILSYRL